MAEHNFHVKSEIKEGVRREMDSPDDFEHLGHDSSPLQEIKQHGTGDLLIGLKQDIATHVHHNLIDTKAGVGDYPTAFQTADNLLDQPLVPQKMDSNLLEHISEQFPDRKEADEKLDKFLQEMSSPFTSQPVGHVEQYDKYNLDDIKSFVDNERILQQEKPLSIAKEKANDLLDRYSDSEAESDDFKPSKYEEIPKSSELPESSDKAEHFKDVEEPQPEPPKKDYPVPSAPVEHVKEDVKEPVRSKDVPTVKPVEEKPKQPEVKKVEAKQSTKEAKHEANKIIEAEALFKKMGLDAWFNPQRLNPKVESLIYWRDPKKSGPVCGGVLVVLLALTYFSFISVVAYLSLIGLTGTIAFRIYKNIIQAVQKTGDGHPFKDLLELDISLPQEKVQEVTQVAVAHLNAGVVELRRLFLVEDLVDSIKFGVFLWTLTYLGAWFNGMTLIIIAWVAFFTLPKVYEANKTQIDANLEIVRVKLSEITSKVKAAIPIGKKSEEKKEQ